MFSRVEHGEKVVGRVLQGEVFLEGVMGLGVGFSVRPEKKTRKSYSYNSINIYHCLKY